MTSDFPRIAKAKQSEIFQRYADSYKAAAGAYASELSSAKDDVTRARIEKKLKARREQAEFNAMKAEEFRQRGE